MDSGPGADDRPAAGETDTALGALFDAAAQPLALIGADGRILRANSALARALGRLGPEDLAGAHFAGLACAPGAEAVADALAAPDTTPFPLTMRCQRADGRHVWFDCSLSAADAGGRVLAQLHDSGEALRLARHSRAVEALTGVGSWEVEFETGASSWSPRVFAIYGLDPQDTPPDIETALAFYPEDARATLRHALALLAETGTPFDLELPFTDAAGRARWVRATGGADMADGRVLRFYGTFEDVTEALLEREHHRRLATIAESTVNGVVVTDRDGRTDWVNATFTRMTGYTLEEMRGRTPGSMLQCTDTDPETVARLSAAIRAGEGVQVEILNRAKDGRDYWVRLDIQPMHDATGALTGFIAIQTDITESKAAEAEIARAARLGRIVESGLTEIYVFDAVTLKFIEVNRGARQNLAYTAEELAGMTPVDLKPDHDRESFEALIAPLRSGAEELIAFRTRHRRRDGSDYPCEIHLQLVREEPQVFVATVLDITEREAAEQEARHAREQLVTAVESLPDGFVLYDAEDRLVISNSRYREFYAESAETMVPGNRFEDILRHGLRRGQYSDAVGREEDWLAERLAAHRAADHTFEQPLGDGRWLRVLERPTPDGGRVGLRMDITEQVESRHRAERAEARLRDAIDTLPAAFWLFDAEDRLVMFNEHFRELFPRSAPVLRLGITYEEFVRYGLARGEYVDAVEREEEWLAEVLARRRAGTYSLEYRTSSGRWIKSYNDPTSDGGIVGFRVDITEEVESRHRAEQAEARLRDAIEALPAAFWLFDADDRLVMFNQRYLDFFPESAPSIEIGAGFEEMIRFGLARGEFPEAAGREEDWLAEILARRRVGAYSHEYPTSSGRWIKSYNDPTSDGGMVGFRVDITEEVESRTRAEQAEARLRDAIEALPAAVTIFDAEDRLILFNQATLELFQRSRPAIEIGVSYEHLTLYGLEHGEFPDATLPESREAFMAERRARRGAKDVYVREYRVSGDRWARSYSTPTSAGGVIDFRIDITELRRREDELRAALAARDAAEQRFFDIASVSADWFWEQDAEGRFTYISESFERTTGGRCDIHIGHTRNELMASNPATLDSADFDWLDARFAAREPFSDFVYRSFAHPDREVWVRISGAPFYDAEGSFAGYRGVGSDVTALYSAMRRAEEASRAKSAFLANMSHEIRTPMNGILGIAEILDMQVHDPEQKRLVATMRESGEVLLNILNDILDVSKIEAGKLDLDPAPFRPVDLARRVESLHTDRASARGISLAVMTGRGADRERLGDSHRLLQILNNLVSNAIKFTEEGEVTVSLREGAEGTLVLEVQDTGIGMSEDEKRHIFEDFVQADSSTSRRYGGTGLGMAIVRKLTETMGGTISLDSAPGSGTRVRISLPLPEAETLPAASEPPAEAEPTDTAGDTPLASLRVLAADDNRTNRLVLEAMLHSLGVRPVIVDSGEAAIEATCEARFDLLLLDISMPGLDGMETLAAIRARETAEGLPATPAIAVTANAMKHQIALYLAQGFAAHIPKPIRSADLSGAMEDILLQPAARGDMRSRLDIVSQAMP